MPTRRSSFSLRTGSIALAALAALGMTLHCGGGGGDSGGNDGGDDSTIDDGGDSITDSTGSETDGTPTDTPTDTPSDTITPVKCTAAPTFGPVVSSKFAPLRLNHNPDALRPIANGALALLPDGRIVAVFLEALDTGTRYALYTRVIDPHGATPTVGADQRLDVDSDNLTSSSSIDLEDLGNGALLLQFFPGGGARRVRVFSHDKWSPEIGSVMSVVDTDGLNAASNLTGTVLVARTHSATPSGQAVVYNPDTGGAFGSWSSPQTLDLAGESGVPTVSPFGLPDGRYLLLVWQGSGGPAVTLRSVSGAWTAPSPKAEIGATDASPATRLLDDGTVVLVALEGTGDTRRVVTSFWTEAASWSTARLLSKTTTGNGVVPFIGGRADPFLFSIDAHEAEFVGWVAECTGAASTCSFHATERTFTTATDWTDPVDLAVGTTTTGADGLRVDALDGSTPVVSRTSTDGTSIQIKARGTATTFPTGAPISILGGSPLFDSSISAAARYYGGAQGLWSIAARTQTPDGGPSTPIASTMGKLDPTKTTPPSWSAVTDAASAEMHGFSPFEAYVDGNGELSIAVNDAVDSSSKTFPILAHATGASGGTSVQRVVLSDETNATFTNGPRTAPRKDLDKSAVFLVQSSLATDGGTAHRLRAYAFNGVGGVKPQLLGDETESPHPFAEGLLTFGCGGAILFSTDPADGSHQLNLSIVQ